MNDRGQYGMPSHAAFAVRGSYGGRPHVGASLWHTIGDREEALATFKRDVGAVYQTLTHQILHATPEHPYGLASDTSIRPDWLAWWQSRAVPFFNDFRDWAAKRSPGNWTRFGPYIAYGAQFTTDWDVYKRWRDQLGVLRKEAEKLGIEFQVSESTPLPTTALEDVEDLAKKTTKDVWQFVKYAVYGVLGVGALVAVSSVVQDLRSGRDPAGKYVELMRRRRPREPLPRATVLQLEEGT